MAACVAAVEIGGTHTRVVAGHDPSRKSVVRRLPTSTPGETCGQVLAALDDLKQAGWPITALGVASFGPLGLHPGRPDYGRILNTPKAGWSGANLAEAFATLGCPMVFETDVNAAALGEGAHGAAEGLRDFAYITCGTGVGVGLCIDGAPVHGRLHPEGGHLRPVRIEGDDFAGSCPWHGDCVEGLACGPAIALRVKRDPLGLPPDHPVWALAGGYLGQLSSAIALLTSAKRIVIGGGVGERPEVLAAARRSLMANLNGYLDQGHPIDPARFMVSAVLPDSGLIGAMVLAARVVG